MINIVIPMAGWGKRFAEKGYLFPKPLIEIKNKPMIEWVVKNLTPQQEHRFVFICRREHQEQYNIGSLLSLIAPNSQVIYIDTVTQGAACTVLLAKEFINSPDPLLIANSDQYVDVDINGFLGHAVEQEMQGLIMTFKATHPKWSFAKVDGNGHVIEVAEKNPISDNATVGVYYYSSGAHFVSAAESMIRKDIRVNNEFYVCPVFNEFVLQDKKVGIWEIPGEKMFGWGTPEDLDYYKTTEHYQQLS